VRRAPRALAAARSRRGHGPHAARGRRARPDGRAGARAAVKLPAVLGANNYHHLRGGSERHFLSLGVGLRARGHRVAHLATRHAHDRDLPADTELLPPIELARPAPADVLAYHWRPAAARATARLVERFRPDVAHLHIYHGQLTPAILAPLEARSIPIVQTLHEYKHLCAVQTFASHGTPCEACAGRHFWRALPRRCNRGSLARTAVSVSEAYLARAAGAARRVTRFLAVSEFVRARFLAHGFDPERVVTLPHALEAAALEPGTGPGTHALYAGRLEGYKGVGTLLEAARAVPELPMLVAGDGPERAAFQHHARDLAHVRFVGQLDDEALAQAIRGARCVVVPSRSYETFGLSALEALARARPVVASAIGALPELVTPEENGLLVPSGDAPALAAALRRLAHEPALAIELGRRARARVVERHHPDEHHARLLAVYRAVGA